MPCLPGYKLYITDKCSYSIVIKLNVHSKFKNKKVIHIHLTLDSKYLILSQPLL